MTETVSHIQTTLWKSGEQVAHADHCGPCVLNMSGLWTGSGRLECYYFSILHLEPPVVFEHLAGRALTHFLDKCSIKRKDEEVYGLRYVHGRSEAMKGKHKVSAVLLAQPQESLEELAWLAALPAIYGEFLAKYTADAKPLD